MGEDDPGLGTTSRTSLKKAGTCVCTPSHTHTHTNTYTRIFIVLTSGNQSSLQFRRETWQT